MATPANPNKIMSISNPPPPHDFEMPTVKQMKGVLAAYQQAGKTWSQPRELSDAPARAHHQDEARTHHSPASRSRRLAAILLKLASAASADDERFPASTASDNFSQTKTSSASSLRMRSMALVNAWNIA